MSDKLPPDPTPLFDTTHEESRVTRVSRFEAIVRTKTPEEVEALGGIVFESAGEAIQAGFLFLQHAPRQEVGDSLGRRLLMKHGQGNWGVSYIPVGDDGEGNPVTISSTVLDVWVRGTGEVEPHSETPTLGHVVGFVLNSSEHHIDKK